MSGKKSERDKFVGTIIDNRYEIIRALGSGNIGRVYFAKDEEIDDEKAIKFIEKEKAKSITLTL